ncbi:MAG: hypothetical protein LIO65_08870 [Odoribacter sp.]|nr:hypothetical protein [Odoribacter sp.]
MMEPKPVTRADLRRMKYGEEKAFLTRTFANVESAKSTVVQMKKLLGCQFSTRYDPTSNLIYITKYAP